ncbi:MAG TPA: nickel pincer cofactor biosynthesis protein LarB [Methanothermococcus okinawensis]|uniref:Nickel pincer cofactor biosynthesis protein LarB n=1 Tax=Methanothermococcus okinawensis TaxID=155863 RepID=A0A832ZKC9_9EURY|nr:nickel pincer cofactor biosynthesis protein LarB [Methanococcaceae archaeon]HIP84504.1 nickel pincer cofactor biosynthesis protein LarB [Methanothermococcus okinawensis]HIP91077.1 nickel pincer cofactor biosynthesis protein LarB [Methanothermococcus okinawensis]
MRKKLRDILNDLAEKRISVEEAESLLKIYEIQEIEERIKLDISRELRTGIPEVIYARNKDFQDVILGLKRAAEEWGIALATKVRRAHILKLEREMEEILKRFNIQDYSFHINHRACTIVLKRKDYKQKIYGKIGLLAAGTSDIPIAEEVRVTGEFLGCEVIHSYDVGIAGIHRLFEPLKGMIREDVCCIVVVAGMEGALPSVVASLVDIPVIGVPVSVGYGVGKDGKSALYSMLTSCVPGVVVVNIDNGFGAASFAALLARRIYRCRDLTLQQ